MGQISTQMTCRSCGKKLPPDLLRFGDLYVVGFGDKDAVAAPLALSLCERCGLLQLRHNVNQDLLFRHYYYKSGVNQTMRDHLTGIVREIELRLPLREGDVVLDIGCNDGTLLRAYMSSLTRIGFEPAKNLLKDARNGGNIVVNDFFNATAFEKVAKGRKARVVTAISMFYDLEDPNKFLRDVVNVLDKDGLLVIQQNYLPAMLEKNAFDNIVHEHLEYYSMSSMAYLLKKNGLAIVDVEFNDLNGGSFRTYIQSEKVAGRPGTVKRSVSEALAKEAKQKLGTPLPYAQFAERIKRITKRLHKFISAETRKRRKVYVYGASTRGNTLLQIARLDHRLISRAVERNPAKWGTRTAGTNIPVISEEEARANSPDYFLILPWHFLGEFVIREWNYLRNGGRFVVPLPEPCVLQVNELHR